MKGLILCENCRYCVQGRWHLECHRLFRRDEYGDADDLWVAPDDFCCWGVPIMDIKMWGVPIMDIKIKGEGTE